MRVNLPDGHHAELRDITDLRRGDVRAAYRMADESGIDLTKGLGVGALAAIQDALIVRFVRSWTIAGPDGVLPVTMEAICDLPLSHYQPLANATQPAFAQVVNSGTIEPDPKQDLSSSPPGNTD